MRAFFDLPETKALFEKLVPLTKVSGERRIDISGKIDLALRYPDGTWRIVDYKTDRVRDPEELKLRYRGQLDLYERALSQITGIRVREKLIYSVALRRVIAL